MGRFGDYRLTSLDSWPRQLMLGEKQSGERSESVNAKRTMLAAIALGLFYSAILARPAQAQEFQGYTCGVLWEHIHTGGFVIFDEVNRWFYSTCTGDSKADDEEESAEAPARRPTVVTCAYCRRGS